MRIISGLMRGTKLFTLEGENTRPTLDRVKEALFSKIEFELEDSIVLDLFSGSGALALESISRGAKKAVLCDSSFEAVKVIKQNIEKTRTQEQTEVLKMNYVQALEMLKERKDKFDIVFLDPPYATDYAVDATKYLVENNMINDDSLIIIETDNKENVINKIESNLTDIIDIKKYGRVYLIFLKRKG